MQILITLFVAVVFYNVWQFIKIRDNNKHLKELENEK